MSLFETYRALILPVHGPLLALHIGGGVVAILAGYVALGARKGETIHRGAGMLFVAAMATMASAALLLAIAKVQVGNITAAFVVFYMVSTALAVVRRPENSVGRFEMLACILIFGLAVAELTLGYLFRNNPNGINGAPYQAAYIFAGVATFAGLLDLRVLRRGGLAGMARLSRHLWRMCLALFIAAGSFFLGQMKVIPHELRGPHLWVLAFLPLAGLIFWMIRIRFRSALNPAPARA